MKLELAAADAAAVEAIAAKDRSNLYLTSQFLTDRRRYQGFTAMYAVMRVIDDLVDDVVDKGELGDSDRDRLHDDLHAWRARIDAAYAGQPGATALDRALAWAVHHFPVSRELWGRFLDAMHYDVDHPRFADFDAFLDYAVGASVAPTTIYVYLLTATCERDGIYRVDRFDYRTCGHQLGIFAYLAHVLRDVRPDALVGQHGLVYLSLADLTAHGLQDTDLKPFAERRVGDPRFSRLVQSVVERARPYEARGVELVEQVAPQLEPDRRFVLRLIVGYYQALLALVADPEHDLFAVDDLLSAEHKLQIAQRIAEASEFTLNPAVLQRALGRNRARDPE